MYVVLNSCIAIKKFNIRAEFVYFHVNDEVDTQLAHVLQRAKIICPELICQLLGLCGLTSVQRYSLVNTLIKQP